MGKQGFLMLLLGVALGANLVLGAWIVSLTISPAQQALGGTVDSGAGFTVGTGRLQGKGDADALYIFSHEDRKLLVYFQNANRLELLAARNCEYDLRPNQYGKQNPSVRDMKEGVGGKK